MKHTIVTLCAGACLIIAGTATAATDPDFNRLDTNKDGLISWPEYAAKNPQSGRLDPRRIFDNVDTNRDSYIDKVEFAEMKRRRDNRK